MGKKRNAFEVSAMVMGAAIHTIVRDLAIAIARVRELEAAAGIPSMRNDEEHPATPEGTARWERLAPDAERIRLAIEKSISEAIDDVNKQLDLEDVE